MYNYQLSDIVTWDGSTYYSSIANNIGKQPDTINGVGAWKIVAGTPGRGTPPAEKVVAPPQGQSQIKVTDFPHYISTTTFVTDMSNAASAQNIRHDTTDAYKCVELDPDSLDAGGTLQVDLLTGELNSSTLQDILLERQVLKEMVVPTEATPGTTYNSKAREAAAFLLAFGIVVTVFISVYSYLSAQESNSINGTARSVIEVILMVIIAVLFIVGTGVGLFSKDATVQNQGGMVVASAAVLTLLFYLYFMVWSPPIAATSTAIAAVGQTAHTGSLFTDINGLLPSWATAAPAAPAAGTATPAPGWSNVSLAILGTLLGFLGFLVGMLIQ
jgi:hypothetical protein